MEGLMKFATGVAPGSVRILAAVGDAQNALVMVTVKAATAPGGQQVTLPGARLYLLDDNGRSRPSKSSFSPFRNSGDPGFRPSRTSTQEEHPMSQPRMLVDRRAIVFGAAGTIGAAVATEFAAEGAEVFLAGRTRSKIEEVAKRITEAGGHAHAAAV